MRTISITLAALALAIAATTWSYVSPLVSRAGTAVIYAMSFDGKHGGKPATVTVPDNLTTRQFDLLNFAYETAAADGYHEPRFLQGIILQESRGCNVQNFRVAGLTNKPGDRYFGCGQIKLAAAKDVMAAYPEMWKLMDTRTDEELQARLILDDKFNIKVASKYGLLMGINADPDKAIASYNVGAGGVLYINPKTHEYTKGVRRLAKIYRREPGGYNLPLGDPGNPRTARPPVRTARQGHS